jgi:hypothetical protein
MLVLFFFHRVFWAFAPCIAGFAHCRPVISIDGTHLYGRYEGKLLIAMAIDANNEVYPLAFAVVESENKDSWKWFLSCIRHYVTNQNLCIISDRHGGIIEAIREDSLWQPPNGHHWFCLRHVASNLIQWYKDKRLKNLIMRAESCKQVYKFNKIMETITKYNGKAVQLLDELTVQCLTLVHDDGCWYGAMTTNLSECFNGVLKGARSLPITIMVQFIFYKLVHYFEDRRTKTQGELDDSEVFSKYAMNRFKRYWDKASRHRVRMLDSSTCSFEITTPVNPFTANRGNHIHNVKLSEKSCICGKWRLYKIPCSHVIVPCAQMSVDVIQYIDPCYKLSERRACYDRSFMPVSDPRNWLPIVGPITCPNPLMKRRRGRPKSTRIKNEMDWREGQISRPSCGICREEGHNRRRCLNANCTSTSGGGTN